MIVGCALMSRRGVSPLSGSLIILPHLLLTPMCSSWTPHSLPITGLELMSSGGQCSYTRVLTVSTDRCLVVHELFSNRQSLKHVYPESLTCCCVNPTFDTTYSGSLSGKIYITTLSAASASLSSAHWKRANESSAYGLDDNQDLGALSGHTKVVSSLAHSRDNLTLVSASLDGDLRVWNTVSRQCVNILSPFNRNPLSNVKVSTPYPTLSFNLNLYLPCPRLLSNLRSWTRQMDSDCTFFLLDTSRNIDRGMLRPRPLSQPQILQAERQLTFLLAVG
jgi:WD40 repeat protein